MNKTTTWNTKHRNVPIEIKKWKGFQGHKNNWAFYIYIREDQFEKEDFEKLWLDGEPLGIGKHIMYRYEDTIIGNLEWHGGCTWYSKEGGHDGNKRIVKVGCDYQHFFDEHQTYSEDYVLEEAIACVNSLYDVVTVKQWCSYCGEYFIDETESNKHCPDCQNK